MKKVFTCLANVLLPIFCMFIVLYVITQLTGCTIRDAAEPTPSTVPTIAPPRPEETSRPYEDPFKDVRPTIIDPTVPPVSDAEMLSSYGWDATQEQLDYWYQMINSDDIMIFTDPDTGIQTIILDSATPYYKVCYRSSGFSITGYCGCEICCGDYANDRPLDKYGFEIVYGSLCVPMVDNASCAVDPRVIPYGSNVYIGGRALRAWDRGPSGKHVDIYHTTHSAAGADPSTDITHSSTVYWSDKGVFIDYYKQIEIEQKIQSGNYLDLNELGMTADTVFKLMVLDS